MQIQTRLTAALIGMFAVLCAGIVGYHVIEGWTLFDSLYMTVITLATVGYGETNPLSPSGRVFTIFLIMGGIGILTYSFSVFTAFLVEGELGEALRRRRMENKIKTLSGHFIICGGGRTGRYIIDELSKVRQPFVIIDTDADQIEHFTREGFLSIEGDASQDETLQKAGISKAKGLVSCLPTDQDNMFVVISAKGLNPGLRVIAKSVEKGVREKLFRAGADGVVSPNFIGGLRMASELVRPAVVSFLDIMLRESGGALRVEEASVGSPADGKTLAESVLKHGLDLVVLAIKPAEKDEHHFNPKPQTLLKKEDVLVVMGEIAEVQKLRAHIG